MLVARDVVCDYGPTRALDGVNLTIGRGGTLAIFGANGAGKSTLLRVLSGERRAEGGQVEMDGVAVAGNDPGWRGRVGVVSHRTGLYRALTVAENLTFFAALRGLPRDRSSLLGALDLAAAAPLADRRVGHLSRGERQRVALARSLMHNPEVLLLDEPFSGLDPSGAERLERLLRTRAEERIVVLVTHDLARGLSLADRVAVLCRGRKTLDAEAVELSVEALPGHFAGAGASA